MGLKLKLDENLPRRAVSALQQLGHDVETAISEGLGGAPDSDVIDACLREQRILVTLDLDFSNIRDYPPAAHAGIWVLRPPMQTFDEVVHLLLAAVKLCAVERPEGRLWVVDDKRVRIRD